MTKTKFAFGVNLSKYSDLMVLKHSSIREVSK